MPIQARISRMLLQVNSCVVLSGTSVNGIGGRRLNGTNDICRSARAKARDQKQTAAPKSNVKYYCNKRILNWPSSHGQEKGRGLEQLKNHGPENVVLPSNWNENWSYG